MTTSDTGTGSSTVQWVSSSSFTYLPPIADAHTGASLIRKYKAAVIEQNRQVEAHRGFTDSLPGHLVEEWVKMCVTWEEDGFPKAQPNPYEIKGARMFSYPSFSSRILTRHSRHDRIKGSPGIGKGRGGSKSNRWSGAIAQNWALGIHSNGP